MAADESLYRVTTRDGRVRVCNRRSLAGKIGLMHAEQGHWVYELDDNGRWRNGSARYVRDRQASARHHIIAIERAPSAGWEDVTEEMLSDESVLGD